MRFSIVLQEFYALWRSIPISRWTSSPSIIRSTWWLSLAGTLPFKSMSFYIWLPHVWHCYSTFDCKRSNKITVYGCSTGHKNPFTWSWVRKTALELWEKYPTVEMMWYPSGYYATSDVSYTIFKFLYHQLPAYIFDLVHMLCGKRRRWVRITRFYWHSVSTVRLITQCLLFHQVRLYDRVHKIFKGYEYFTTHQWRFISENFIQLHDQLSEKDKQTFYFDVRQIDWTSYMEDNVLGTRRFILNDDHSTLPAARKNLKR